MLPNVIISISGLPKTGKTHLALTSPEPIKIFSFDGRADYIRRKFPDKAIDIVNFRLPIVESEDMTWAAPVWEDFYCQYKEAIESTKYQTVIVDTATTAHTILAQAVLEWVQDRTIEEVEQGRKGKKREKLAPNEYYTRNLKMKALFDLARNAGINLIAIQYLGEKWVIPPGKKVAVPTEELKVQGWGQTEAFSDINIEMSTKEKTAVVHHKPTKKTVMVATIKSNGFDRDQNGQSFEDTTFNEIITLLLGGE